MQRMDCRSMMMTRTMINFGIWQDGSKQNMYVKRYLISFMVMNVKSVCMKVSFGYREHLLRERKDVNMTITWIWVLGTTRTIPSSTIPMRYVVHEIIIKPKCT